VESRETNLRLLEFGVPPSKFEEDVGSEVLEARFCKGRELLTSLVPLWMKIIPIWEVWHWTGRNGQGGEP